MGLWRSGRKSTYISYWRSGYIVNLRLAREMARGVDTRVVGVVVWMRDERSIYKSGRWNV